MLVDHLALGFKYQHFELVIGIMGYYTDVIHTVINEVVYIRSKKISSFSLLLLQML